MKSTPKNKTNIHEKYISLILNFTTESICSPIKANGSLNYRQVKTLLSVYIPWYKEIYSHSLASVLCQEPTHESKLQKYTCINKEKLRKKMGTFKDRYLSFTN